MSLRLPSLSTLAHVLILAFAAVFAVLPARAGVTVSGVSVEGVRAVLPLPEMPRGALILLAGGDGYIGVDADGSIAQTGNQLVRTRHAYAAQGFAVLVPEGNVNIAEAVKMMGRYGPVTLVGTSRGTQRAARGVAAGARPARLVLTSGFLSDASGDFDNVTRILGTPDALPPTLVIEHRNDACPKTLPAGVAPFLAWSKGKAKAVWIDGGESVGDACQANAHHGFKGVDAKVVAAVSAFAAR